MLNYLESTLFGYKLVKKALKKYIKSTQIEKNLKKYTYIYYPQISQFNLLELEYGSYIDEALIIVESLIKYTKIPNVDNKKYQYYRSLQIDEYEHKFIGDDLLEFSK